jgi:hypothetical protein
MSYAILRVEKLKTYSSISASSNHIHRRNETPNADPQRRRENLHVGSTQQAVAVKALLESKGVKPRSDAVLANEYLLTASPEFFQGMDKSDIQKWAKANIKFLKDKHGDGFISATVHLDEKTPHIHAVVCPIYENKKGQTRLSAKHYFDKPKLRKLQTDYAKAMEQFGLERGVKNSKRKHTEIKKYYGELGQEISAARADIKPLLKKAEEVKQSEPGFFSYKTMFFQAVDIIKRLSSRLSKLTSLNAALNNKYENTVSNLSGQIEAMKTDRDNLERLYNISGLEPNDPERFQVLEARVQDDAQRRQEQARQDDIDRDLAATPAEQLGIQSDDVEQIVIPRQRMQQQNDQSATYG